MAGFVFRLNSLRGPGEGTMPVCGMTGNRFRPHHLSGAAEVTAAGVKKLPGPARPETQAKWARRGTEAVSVEHTMHYQRSTIRARAILSGTRDWRRGLGPTGQFFSTGT